MQSAFVDLGLERDAFLYVTDFLEMEDPEDSDEVEKAAVTGGAQAPREINRTPQPVEKTPRTDGRRGDRAEQDRTPRDRKPAPEPTFEVESIEAVPTESPAAHGSIEDEGEAGGEQGGKRWRGRRRRRGGRGQAAPVSDPVETEASAETFLEPSGRTEPAVASELLASSYEAPTPSREISAPPMREARPERQARSVPASWRVAFEVWRRTCCHDDIFCVSTCSSGAPGRHVQALDSDRKADRMGRQRTASR